MERRLNRSQQGDLGEASAVEWFTGRGATVFLPFGHSPNCDLIAELDGRLLRVQVKTSTQETQTPGGSPRLPVAVRTSGGNRSWTGEVKQLDPSQFEYLFVLTGGGRRWLIPAAALDSGSLITLGGPKYSEFEIEPGQAIRQRVYAEAPSLESPPPAGEYPSGQRMAAVNRPAQPSQVRILPPPSAASVPTKPTNYERSPGKRGEAVINQKRRLTIPQRPFFEAGLANGAKVRVRSDGPGRIVVEQIELPEWAQPDQAQPDQDQPDHEAEAA